MIFQTCLVTKYIANKTCVNHFLIASSKLFCVKLKFGRLGSTSGSFTKWAEGKVAALRGRTQPSRPPVGELITQLLLIVITKPFRFKRLLGSSRYLVILGTSNFIPFMTSLAINILF